MFRNFRPIYLRIVDNEFYLCGNNLTLLNIFKYDLRQERGVLFASKLFVEFQNFIARYLSSRRRSH